MQVDGEVYIVPVDAGTAGIMYNADVDHDAAHVVDATCSIRSTPGRASLEDLAITALDVGALANGIAEPARDDRRAARAW